MAYKLAPLTLSGAEAGAVAQYLGLSSESRWSSFNIYATFYSDMAGCLRRNDGKKTTMSFKSQRKHQLESGSAGPPLLGKGNYNHTFG